MSVSAQAVIIVFFVLTADALLFVIQFSSRHIEVTPDCPVTGFPGGFLGPGQILRIEIHLFTFIADIITGGIHGIIRKRFRLPGSFCTIDILVFINAITGPA